MTLLLRLPNNTYDQVSSESSTDYHFWLVRLANVNPWREREKVLRVLGHILALLWVAGLVGGGGWYWLLRILHLWWLSGSILVESNREALHHRRLSVMLVSCSMNSRSRAESDYL